MKVSIQKVYLMPGYELSETERRVIERHRSVAGSKDGTFVDGMRVHQWENATSVYFASTGRLWVHNNTARKQALQELYFHSMNSVCNTLTCAHAIKFWDLGRHATPRELLRLQGFPEWFKTPLSCATRLVGNAIAVPCAAHACACIVEKEEVGISHVDVCAGIGGFTCAMSLACPGTTCVGFSEINTAAINSYKHNFPDVHELGDAEEATAWPRCDVLTAGFPCQPFSSANSRARRDAHAKRDFFQTVVDVIKKTEAQRIVLENVQNLLTVGRERFDDMSCQLHALGFVLDYDVLNAKDFGVAQHRKRVYIVGRRDGGCIRPIRDYRPIQGAVIGHIVDSSSNANAFP